MSVLLEGIGKRVRERRDLLDLTQQQVGDAINLSRSSVANIEAGRQELPVTTLALLADVLGMTMGGLCGEEPLADVPTVSIVTMHTVLCDQCGTVGDFEKADTASEARRRHTLSHLSAPAGSGEPDRSA